MARALRLNPTWPFARMRPSIQSSSKIFIGIQTPRDMNPSEYFTTSTGWTTHFAPLRHPKYRRRNNSTPRQSMGPRGSLVSKKFNSTLIHRSNPVHVPFHSTGTADIIHSTLFNSNSTTIFQCFILIALVEQLTLRYPKPAVGTVGAA